MIFYMVLTEYHILKVYTTSTTFSYNSISDSKAHTGGLRGKVSRYLTGKRSEGKRVIAVDFLR